MFTEVRPEFEIAQYATAFLLLMAAVVLTIGLLTLSRLLRPNNPSATKNMTYECGEEPLGSGWLRFNIRFYVVALVFVLFDVEMALVYPVAEIFGPILDQPGGFQAGLIIFGELFFFVGVLFMGLIYVWKKGDLGWIRTYRKPTDHGLRSWRNPASAAMTPIDKN